jgi:AraC family transcriptional regulator
VPNQVGRVAYGLHSADAPVFERYDERFDARTGMGGFEIWAPLKP